MVTNVELPAFEPRDYQKPLLQAVLKNNIKRAFCLWHRRSGKDLTLINLIACKAMQRIGIYYYFFPTYAQAKKVLWDGIDGNGKKFLDYIPEEIIKSKNQTELKIEFVNGSIFQLIGTDKYDAIRGTNPVGCVFSEYAFQNPSAWDVVRPILGQNDGFAIFNTTPNGKNHAYDLWELVKDNPTWFTQKLSIKATGAVTEEFIQEEKVSGMSEEMVEQEYYCSFDVGALGSIYGAQMKEAWQAQRITELPFYVEKPLDIHFDLGISKGNETAMWFSQEVGEFHHFVNYYEGSGKSFEHFASYIEEYVQQIHGKLGTIYIPHDANKREWVTGITAVQAFEDRFGAGKIIRLEPNAPTDMGGLQKARAVFPKCKFDQVNCKQGIRCLENYKYEYDDVKKVFRSIPYHDWSSNGADAFRYFAITPRTKAVQKTGSWAPKYYHSLA